MCGINGIVGTDTASIDVMIEKTKHRGPDATGRYVRQGVAFGHNRLSVLDPHVRSNQPFVSQDGRYVLVYNGEIYNYKELRKELNEYTFVTDSDTEVLLALLIQDGESAISKLNGIFAFAFWDARNREVLLARDPMGVKPLYYTQSAGRFVFSSELTAISAASPSLRSISQVGLSSYLGLGYTLSPESICTGIKKISAGYMLRYSEEDQIVTHSRYWRGIESCIQPISNELICDTIDTAVKRQLTSDRQLGITLSGGLDSNIILYHAKKYAPHIQTFSSAFEENEQVGVKFNQDAILAAQTAQKYGVPHKRLEISGAQIRDNLEGILSQQAEPVANATAVTRSLLYKMMRQEGAVVVLGGDGGDELFGGYSRYQRVLATQYFQQLPHVLQVAIGMLYPRARDLGLRDEQLHLRLMAQPRDAINWVLKQDYWSSPQFISGVFDALYEEHRNGVDEVARFMQVDRESWLAEESLLQTDVNSMRHGIEARVPMLDLEVVKLSDQIATHKKMSLTGTKLQLREAYRNVLPAYLFDQPKRGWQSPGAKWLRDAEIQPLIRNIFSSAYYSGLDSVIDWDRVQDLYTRHVEHKEYHLYPLWHILQLQVWAREHNMQIDTHMP